MDVEPTNWAVVFRRSGKTRLAFTFYLRELVERGIMTVADATALAESFIDLTEQNH